MTATIKTEPVPPGEYWTCPDCRHVIDVGSMPPGATELCKCDPPKFCIAKKRMSADELRDQRDEE